MKVLQHVGFGAAMLAVALSTSACGDITVAGKKQSSAAGVSASAPSSGTSPTASVVSQGSGGSASAASPSASESASGAQSASSSAAASPGGQRVVGPKTKVVLEVPAGWTVLTKDSYAAMNASQQQDVATQNNQSADKLKTLLDTQYDVLATAKGGASKGGAIAITQGPSGAYVSPSRSALESEYKTRGGVITSFEQTKTALGDGTLVEANLTVGLAKVYQQQLFTDDPTGHLAIIVTTSTYGPDAKKLMDDLIPTLSKS